MSGWMTFWYIVLGLILVPILVYLCTHMGAMAFYRARIEYLKHFRKGGMNYGQDEKTGQGQGSKKQKQGSG